MRDLLARTGFRRLLVGQAVSGVGDWMATVALMVFVLHLSDSATAVGGVLVLRLLPSLVAAPLAARAAGRFGRRRVMLAMDLARAGCAVALPLIGALWWVYVWAIAVEVASLIFLPARDASVPVLAGRSQLGLANALVLGSSYGSIPVGAALFGFVYWLADWLGASGQTPYVIVFWLDALTFVASYIAIRGISLAETEDRGPREARQGDGFIAALRLPLVQAVLPGLACVTLGVGALFSVGVAYVLDVLDASPVQFGMLIAAFGVGAATGLAARERIGGGSAVAQVRLGAVLQGVTVTTMSLTGVAFFAMLGAVVFGLATTVTLVAAMSLLQGRLAGADRDLAFAAVHITTRALLVIAALAAGAAADLAPTVEWGLTFEPAQLVLGCAGLVVVLGGLTVREP